MAQIGIDIGSYTFDASLKTITFSGVTINDIEQIKPIVNGSEGVVIFNPATAGSFGSLAGNVLTLDFNTTTHADTDDLYICINLPNVDALLRFQKDNVAANVSIDTVTPANNEPLPTAVYNERGEMGKDTNPVGVAAFDSQTASRQIIDLNGAAKVGEAIILLGDKFGTYEPNPLQWVTDFVGSGASIAQPGTQRIETSTTANSEARFQSVKAGRFMISQFNIFHGGIELDNIADANCERRFGAFNPIDGNQNGCYFALIDGAWNVAYCKNGVETLVPQANWNGTNKDLFNANPALSVYEIQYNAGAIFFFQGPNFIHRVSGLVSPYAAVYDFKVACEVKNTDGNTTNNGINFRALGTYRLGEERGETISRSFTANTLIKTGAGYCEHAYLSRTGSGGGAAALFVYDGIDNTGVLMKRIDVGADDYKGGSVKATFSEGLYIEMTGTGTKSADLSFE